MSEPPSTIKVDFENKVIFIDSKEALYWHFGRPDFKPKERPEEPYPGIRRVDDEDSVS
jgi:hypothetical protein